jgi:hypothetical protein
MTGRFLALALLANTTGRCGPTDLEAGRAVLAASPAVVLAIGLFLHLLLRLWRRRYAELRFPHRLLWTLGGGLLVLGLTLLVVGPSSRAADWVPAALWIYGTSHLAVALVLFRIWFFFDRPRALAAAVIGSSLVMLLPALPVALGLQGSLLDAVTWSVWMWPGYGGLIPGPILLVLLIEAALRGRAARTARP